MVGSGSKGRGRKVGVEVGVGVGVEIGVGVGVEIEAKGTGKVLGVVDVGGAADTGAARFTARGTPHAPVSAWTSR